MKKVKLDIIGIFSNHSQEAIFTLLLGEMSGYRKLPIMIGTIEAESIALALEGNVLERPIMHDLFKETLLKMGYMVEEAMITSLKDEIFFAQLLITDGKQTLVLDARPSDAIAISLRFGAPLFINEALLNQGGSILVSKFERSEIGAELDIQALLSNAMITNFENHSVQALQELLAWVVGCEDYEQAALIRDELKRRNI